MQQNLRRTIIKSSSHIAVLLFAYFLIQVACSVVYFILGSFFSNESLNISTMMSEALGIPSIVMAMGTILIVYFFRHREYFIKDLTYSAQPMKWSMALIVLLLIFTADNFTNLIIQLFMTFNIDISASYDETFNHIIYTPYNIFYIGIIGPIAEEILFRGAVLRTFLPYGRNFAIISSALLFGLMHGNAVQFISAGLLGIMLGIVAINYGMRWTIAIHIFNNLVLSLGVSFLSDQIQDYIVYFSYFCSITFLALCYYYRDKIMMYYQAGRVKYPVFKYWLSSKLMLTWLILAIISTILSCLMV